MPNFLEQRPEAVCDTECLPNYWSIGFKSISDGRTRVFEHYDGCPLDRKAIAKIIRTWRIYTFNGEKYDVPMILYAMSGATPGELKQASDELIQRGTPHLVFMERMGLSKPDFMDHVDLMQVSPGAPTMPSLKLLGGRLHSKRMQEMPVDIDEWVTEVTRTVIRKYHVNDLDTTIDLYRDLKAQIDLRAVMSNEYGVDLRSKSDAQIAEAVIKSEIERLTGRKLYKPDIKPGSFYYEPPPFIQFESDYLKGVLAIVKHAKFTVDSGGIVHMSDELKSLKITLGDSVYQMGSGGLHSTENAVSHYSDDEYVVADNDCVSYYPNIIQTLGLYPKHIGPQFLSVYKRIYDRRIAAKRAGEKNIAETLKIVLNGSFGKFGSPYSVLYSPHLMIQTTVTGQLALLMAIEQIEKHGMRVISANTDGIVTKIPRAKRSLFNAILFDWECATGWNMEETIYRSLHIKNVNNYIAIC